MTKKEALVLLQEHIKNQNLIRHCVAVEAIMQALARKFNQNEDDWGLAGLLHDLDWEKTKETPDRHSLLSKEILEKTDLKPEIIQAIYVHNHVHGLTPQTLLEKT